MIDSKPRSFSYVSHKDSYPLELKGNMRRRSRPQSSAPTERPLLGSTPADR